MKHTYNNKTVGGYIKTPRFKKRQRERSIPDALIRTVLTELLKNPPARSSFNVITSATFMQQLRSMGLYFPQLGVTESLVLQLEGRKLVTISYDRQMLKIFSEIWNRENLHIL